MWKANSNCHTSLRRCQLTVVVSRISGKSNVCSTVRLTKKHQIRVNVLLVRAIHRWPVDSNTENVSIRWRHDVSICSILNAFSCSFKNSLTTWMGPICQCEYYALWNWWIGEFPAKKPVTRSSDVFFDLRLNKRLSNQSWGWWFETLSPPLWRHRSVTYDTVLFAAL